MEEQNKGDSQKPVPPAAPPPNGELAKELERVRGRHKILKIVTILLSAVFIVILIAAAFIYHKISRLAAAFTERQESSPQSSFSSPYGPMGQQPQSSFAGISYSTQNPSSLMLLTGLNQPSGGGGLGAMPPIEPQKMIKLMSKYSKRPIVKDFIAELNKDPKFRKATEGGDPMAMLALMQDRQTMQKMMMKFAMRPDFFPFMNEVMGDPDVAPLLAGIPGGAQASQMLRNRSGRQDPSLPAVTTATWVGVPDSTTSGGVQLDPVPIRGTRREAPAPIKTKTPPPMTE